MMASDRPLAISVTVPSEDLSYPVLVGGGLLARVGPQVKRDMPRASTIALISDDNVMPIYGPQVQASLQAEGFEVVPLSIEPGEVSKTPERMLDLVRQLVVAGLARTDGVVALGGGVVGDLAGLVAAVFMRGVGLVQCPTSLLAQVDASVGGKVAVDLPEGKNLLGAFHFPRSVIIDPSVLRTLADDELGCGLAEMLKHGALFSAEHFEQLLERAPDIYERKLEVLSALVATSVALKAACVSRDPLETTRGKGRVLLNLGHTVGHAIERVSNFSLKHGQAVGLGLRAAARLSARKGWARPELEDRIVQALVRARLPHELDPWLAPEYAQGMQNALRHDKKRASDTVTYIALSDIAQPRVESLPVTEILGLLRPESGGC